MARRIFKFELPVERDWEAIEPLRQTVTACLRVVFRDRLRASAARRTAGLGLSRIAHEGGCDLTVGVGPGWVLTVRATTRRLGPAAPIAAPPA